MARQGKMHSCPFHVETAAYKYAVEHENDGYDVPTKRVSCGYLNSAKKCSLWNSGCTDCAAYKCRYIRGISPCTNKCTDCAYYYQLTCFHPKADLKEEQSENRANYCCYFLSKETNYSKYLWATNCVARMTLTREVEAMKKTVSKRKKYIRSSEKEIKKHPEGSSEFLYWKKKITDRVESIAVLEKKISSVEKELSALGGPLSTWPQRNRKRIKR